MDFISRDILLSCTPLVSPDPAYDPCKQQIQSHNPLHACIKVCWIRHQIAFVAYTAHNHFLEHCKYQE